jgi:hypothetical protein
MGSFIIRIYKPLSLALAVMFAAVGLLFLVVPGGVVEFFNRLSGQLGFQPSPLYQPDFFLILAVGYMAVVTFVAWSMFRRPGDASFPTVLAVAKFSSSLLSFVFFFRRAPYLMYLTNALVDGLIAVVALLCLLALKQNANRR